MTLRQFESRVRLRQRKLVSLRRETTNAVASCVSLRQLKTGTDALKNRSGIDNPIRPRSRNKNLAVLTRPYRKGVSNFDS
jgi:hypothetical protein